MRSIALHLNAVFVRWPGRLVGVTFLLGAEIASAAYFPQQAKLVASDGASLAFLGSSIAIEDVVVHSPLRR
jgi:hypothetical protein